MKKELLLLTLTAVITACQSQPQIYGYLDPNNKRIAVPIRNIGYAAWLKNELRLKGWDVTLSGVSAQSTTTLTNPDGTINTVTTPNANARYTLYYNTEIAHEWGHAVPDVQISIYDNKTSREIISYGGIKELDKANAKLLLKAIEKAMYKR